MSIHRCRREQECTRYQKFKYHELTAVAIVPHHNKYIPWTIVPNGASCRIICTFFEEDEIKSKMATECNLGQFYFFDVQIKYAACLLDKEQFHKVNPHVMREIGTKARRGRNIRSWAFHCLPDEQSGCAGKKAT